MRTWIERQHYARLEHRGRICVSECVYLQHTTAARTGAQVAQVPHHQFSLWNKYQVFSKFGVGLGIVHRSDMFAAIDNTVTLPGYTKVDAAVFVPLNEKLRLQANF